MTEYDQWTDEQLEIESAAMQAELTRRRTLVSAEAQMNSLSQLYLNASGVQQEDEWRQPEGAHDSYPATWVVTHNGKRWVSTLSGNVWEPGTTGWRQLGDDEDVIVPWVQPVGAHDAYKVGDKVTHDAKTWISNAPNNVWTPGVYGWSEILVKGKADQGEGV